MLKNGSELHVKVTKLYWKDKTGFFGYFRYYPNFQFLENENTTFYFRLLTVMTCRLKSRRTCIVFTVFPPLVLRGAHANFSSVFITKTSILYNSMQFKNTKFLPYITTACSVILQKNTKLLHKKITFSRDFWSEISVRGGRLKTQQHFIF